MFPLYIVQYTKVGLECSSRYSCLQSELRIRPKISQKLSQLIRYDPTPANPKTMKKKKKKASSTVVGGMTTPHCTKNVLLNTAEHWVHSVFIHFPLMCFDFYDWYKRCSFVLYTVARTLFQVLILLCGSPAAFSPYDTSLFPSLHPSLSFHPFPPPSPPVSPPPLLLPAEEC